MSRVAVKQHPWHAVAVEDAAEALATSPEQGLSAAEAQRKLTQYGRNVPGEAKEEPWWEEVFESLTEPLVLLLIAVAVLYGFLGELSDAITIFFVILTVAAVEVFNEARAKRAIASLRTLSAPTATVVRSGSVTEAPTAEVVPGDLVLVESGDRAPADVRLTEASALRVDESSLTGESVPVNKKASEALQADVELGDRLNMVFAGTVVTAGKGRGIVVATGRETVLGGIASLAREAGGTRTPLQRHLSELARWLVWLALAFSIAVPVLGVLVARRPVQEMLLTGLTLAFATIPEELPILITIVLGLGAYRLARRNAIVRDLQAAETLGSVSVVGTDKTGTLTENRMSVAEIVTAYDGSSASDGDARRLLEVGVLANDAQLSSSDGRISFTGDPTETALLAAAEDRGLGVESIRQRSDVTWEYPFDDVRKRMSVVYERDGERWLVLKGAPETAIDVSTWVATANGTEPLSPELARNIRARVDEMAGRGLRVLALAERRLEQSAGMTDDPSDVEHELVLLGLVGLEDPPRPEVREAVEQLNRAGVRVVMITGDHPAAAQAIAARVGIDSARVVRGGEVEELTDDGLQRLVGEVSVFARVAPEHKLRIVRALRASGEVVAVTGDGVNDAPALREAAIGVAMGRSGTDIAREAGDLVLADDNFATVSAAVRAGRTLYLNLHKAVRYYLGVKVALVSSSLVAVLAGLPVPFAPVQIILLELLMDLGASTTFVAEPAERDVMARPPRPSAQPFMDRSMKLGILLGGIILAAGVLAVYFWTSSRYADPVVAQSAAFVTWLIGHIALAASMRSERQPLLTRNPFSNLGFDLWALAAVALAVLGPNVPLLQTRLDLGALPTAIWLAAIAASAVVLVLGELVKLLLQPRLQGADYGHRGRVLMTQGPDSTR